MSVPVILSGPILRRVEPARVCIWLATSKPATVKAYIYRLSDLKNSNNTSAAAIGLGTTETIRLGQMLYVALVIALPVNSNKRENDHDTFPADEILCI